MANHSARLRTGVARLFAGFERGQLLRGIGAGIVLGVASAVVNPPVIEWMAAQLTFSDPKLDALPPIEKLKADYVSLLVLFGALYLIPALVTEWAGRYGREGAVSVLGFGGVWWMVASYLQLPRPTYALILWAVVTVLVFEFGMWVYGGREENGLPPGGWGWDI